MYCSVLGRLGSVSILSSQVMPCHAMSSTDNTVGCRFVSKLFDRCWCVFVTDTVGVVFVSTSWGQPCLCLFVPHGMAWHGKAWRAMEKKNKSRKKRK